MRDINPRSRERFDLSLDGRQIASVVVGAIVVLAVVFLLGLNVGKQIARAEHRPQPGGAETLAALDQAPVPPAPEVREESLTYHDRLVKERPSAPPVEPPAARAPPGPVAAPVAEAEVAASEAPPAAAVAEPPPTAAPEEAPAPPPAGSWCVQVGAANDRVEAERIAAKFERFHPRIEVAILQGKTWYRVRIGGYDEKADAEKFLKDLSRETGAKGFVTSTR